MARTAEKLPEGNVWEYSDRNVLIKPALYGENIHTDLSEVSEKAQLLVARITSEFIRTEDGWTFTAVAGRKDSVGIIYSNYKHSELTRDGRFPFDCLRPGSIDEDASLAGYAKALRLEPINDVLKGTNLWAYNAFSQINEIRALIRTGVVFPRNEFATFYQTGIAVVLTNMRPIEGMISEENFEIEQIKREADKKLLPHYTKLVNLKLAQVSNPAKLF